MSSIRTCSHAVTIRVIAPLLCQHRLLGPMSDIEYASNRICSHMVTALELALRSCPDWLRPWAVAWSGVAPCQHRVLQSCCYNFGAGTYVASASVALPMLVLKWYARCLHRDVQLCGNNFSRCFQVVSASAVHAHVAINGEREMSQMGSAVKSLTCS